MILLMICTECGGTRIEGGSMGWRCVQCESRDFRFTSREGSL